MTELITKIGLEIHVQLKTKSKMFCGCDNDAEGKAPNTLVCPVCLGLPGALPVANKQAIEWTLKAGQAFFCEIAKVAKFDRKHYFYPDLPKGYQISQYDEPFCIGGYLEIDGHKIRLNRIHLEEDAGKLIHAGGKSLIDLNRAGTPLMEIVTEPDIASPKEAGAFLRKLQKIVRDVAGVSEASMEKGHLRCDANISVSEGTSDEEREDKMSPIVELKNINSFRFIEKALVLVEEKLRDEYREWPAKKTKETWGYDSDVNKVYLQRRKEEAADYRYFPEPDLPPIYSDAFDLAALKAELQEDEESKIEQLVSLGVPASDAKVLVGDNAKYSFFGAISGSRSELKSLAAKAVVHNYFGFAPKEGDLEKAAEYQKLLGALNDQRVNKNIFVEIAAAIHDKNLDFDKAFEKFSDAGLGEDKVEEIVAGILAENESELTAYRSGKKQLFGFFMGQAMKKTAGKANPQTLTKILNKLLEG
jgi:aspartyl-tRNA(Asn)/glutamyl-tRNA(Gln) amidotransferase subunit B